ncbi:MAG: cytochrome oxidase subunit [Solirubrobacterales bacterium]|nr:cytochrome oxidase subunit [Solirubrobacterales bacterium]
MGTTTAQAEASVARPRRERRLPGEEGTWVFILGDLTVFAVMFGVFLYYRGQDPELFRSSQEQMRQGFGVVNTLLLLTSSLFVVVGVHAVRAQRHVLAQRMFLLALGCGLAFAGVKYFEYTDKLDHGFKPATNDFWMYYFTLTGVHLFHVVVGMGMLGFLSVLARREELNDRMTALLEGGACFWHMVDLLWIVLFALLYLAR